MKNKGYADFTDERVEDIVVGVPITLPPGQVAGPCYPQIPPNFMISQPQTYQHNPSTVQYQTNPFQGMPPSISGPQQMIPQLQRQYSSLYLEL
jgi:hypothetical protein